MNSTTTEAESLQLLDALKDYEPVAGLPRSFRQHREPKIRKDDLQPVQWDQADDDLNWCPPGHGDVYLALVASGTLNRLLDAGFRYAFVSNADNLGAVVDPAILGYLVQKNCPLLMEVAERTEMDRKGGHLARDKKGTFILRESAQCAPGDAKDFQNINRHRFFNTNSLWLDLHKLKEHMQACQNKLNLPLICNLKTVDPRDSSSTSVYQLETAMGSAIAVFPGSLAICVPRSRFAPVKTTNDLLLVRSDAYEMTEDWRVIPSGGRAVAGTVVDLDTRYYKLVRDLDARFPFGPPSLAKCESLRVEGDFTFGRNVSCIGNALIKPPPLFVPNDSRPSATWPGGDESE